MREIRPKLMETLLPLDALARAAESEARADAGAMAFYNVVLR